MCNIYIADLSWEYASVITSSEFLWLSTLNLKPSDCGKIIFSPKRPDRSRNTLEN